MLSQKWHVLVWTAGILLPPKSRDVGKTHVSILEKPLALFMLVLLQPAEDCQLEESGKVWTQQAKEKTILLTKSLLDKSVASVISTSALCSILHNVAKEKDLQGPPPIFKAQ